MEKFLCFTQKPFTNYRQESSLAFCIPLKNEISFLTLLKGFKEGFETKYTVA